MLYKFTRQVPKATAKRTIIAPLQNIGTQNGRGRTEENDIYSRNSIGKRPFRISQRKSCPCANTKKKVSRYEINK